MATLVAAGKGACKASDTSLSARAAPRVLWPQCSCCPSLASPVHSLAQDVGHGCHETVSSASLW